MVARVTPLAKRRFTNSSANSPSCSTPMGPVITTSVTRSRHVPRRTRGSSASSGNVLIASTTPCTSSAARDMSQPGSKSNVTDALPSRETARELCTPSTPNNAGSTTCTIAASTSSAPAPCQPTETVTLSTTTSGKNCARILGSDAAPNTSITTNNKFAAVLCRVKYDRTPPVDAPISRISCPSVLQSAQPRGQELLPD